MKKFFNFKLMKDAIAQTKLIGILSLVITLLMTIIKPISYAIEAANSNTLTEEVTYLYDANFCGSLILCVFAIAPILALYTFSFLNKRNASDFYHSIPITRKCLFISYMAAIIFWITTIVVTNSVMGYILCTTLMNAIPHISSIITYIAAIWIASMYVAATVALAMSVSGTVFTNVTVTFLLLIVPRAILFVITGCLSGLPYIVEEQISPILDTRYNLLIDLFVLQFDYWEEIIQIPHLLYTIVITILFLIAGALLFCKRHSESAERSAPSKRLHVLYRTMLCFAICLIPIANMSYDAITYECSMKNVLSYLSFGEVICYIFALVAFFSYELIITKKFKSIIKALPGLLYVVVANALMLGTITILTNIQNNISPDAKEITAVYITDDYYETEYSYMEKLVYDVPIKDKKAKEIVSDRLKEMLEHLEDFSKYEVGYYDDESFIKTYYADAFISTDESIYSYYIKIQCGNKTYHRKIYLTESDYEYLQECILQSEDFQKRFITLPDYENRYTNFSISEYYSEVSKLKNCSNSQKKKLYNQIQKEIKEIGYEKWYEMNINGSYDSGELATVKLYSEIDNTLYNIRFPICWLPESYKMYCNMTNTDKTKSTIKKCIETALTENGSSVTPSSDIELYACVINLEDSTYYYESSYAIEEYSYYEDYLDSEDNETSQDNQEAFDKRKKAYSLSPLNLSLLLEDFDNTEITTDTKYLYHLTYVTYKNGVEHVESYYVPIKNEQLIEHITQDMTNNFVSMFNYDFSYVESVIYTE